MLRRVDRCLLVSGLGPMVVVMVLVVVVLGRGDVVRCTVVVVMRLCRSLCMVLVIRGDAVERPRSACSILVGARTWPFC